MAVAQRPTGGLNTAGGNTKIPTAGSNSPSGHAGGFGNNTNPYGNNTDATDSVQTDEATKGIDYNHVEESDSALTGAVYIFHRYRFSPKTLTHTKPTLEPGGVAFYDRLDALNGDYYLSAGGLGHPHLSLYAFGSHPSVNSWIMPCVNIGYSKTPDNISLYQTHRPYTTFSYNGSIHKDNQVLVSHTQNIRPRWNFSVDYDLVNREGVYTRNGVNSKFFDFTTNYYSTDARYQVQAGLVRQNIAVMENGGIANDSYFTNGNGSNRSGVPVTLYQANSQWRTLDIFVHQTYNTVRQFQHVRPIKVRVSHDSIAARRVADSVVSYDTIAVFADSVTGYDTIQPHDPHFYNTGVFGLNVDFSKTKRNFHDLDPSDQIYSHYYYGNTATHDSVTAYMLRADLYWTNDAYMDHRWHNPLKITAGVSPQIKTSVMVHNRTQWFNLVPFARGELKVGRSILSANAEYTMSGLFENSDRHLDVAFDKPFENSRLRIAADFTSAAPQLFYYRYFANNYQWSYRGYDKIRTQKVMATWTYDGPADSSSRHLNAFLHTSATHVGGNVWLTSDLKPHQSDADAILFQARANVGIVLGWFHLDMQHILQHSSVQDVIRVPLFATKNSLYADFHVFHKALHMQTGFDLRYHTAYYADAYSPALGAFYRQDDVQIGNYVWADFFITLKIKQACVYLKATHLNALFEQERHDFVLPHYPGEDFGLYYGIVWQFFN